jgi:hypothetical protein
MTSVSASARVPLRSSRTDAGDVLEYEHGRCLQRVEPRRPERKHAPGDPCSKFDDTSHGVCASVENIEVVLYHWVLLGAPAAAE